MTTVASLLVELGVEELPPKALRALGDAFAAGLANSLRAQGLASDDTRVTPYASPRRLAAHLTGVLAKGADRAVAQKLMPVSVALDASGAATPALLKKLAALGAGADAVSSLKRRMDGKAEALFLDATQPGATLTDALQKALEDTLAKLPIPKVMTYQLADGWTSVNFARPAHTLVALYGAEVVPVTILGLAAGRATHGHRFEAVIDPVVVRDADGYAAQLESEGAVIASFAARRAEIERQVRGAAAGAGTDLHPVDDDALLDEVSALVERPNVLVGRFEESFLDVPQECLILTMKANQKYFPLLGTGGKLSNRFLIVSNIRPADTSAVVQGNERVVRPRLADAKFFFDQDRKKSLEERVAGLARVVYHNKLGSQGERSERVRAIATAIARKLWGDAPVGAVGQAARLAKADLLTDMVGEFPELQGIMGAYYARHDGLSPEVAEAIEDHYKPRFAGDTLPRGNVGIAVALADKLETVVGLFGIGQIPTGDRDPFGLRRHSLGIIRMLVERNLPIGLATLIELAREAMPTAARGEPAPPLQFILGRAEGFFEERGFDVKAIRSVLGPFGATSPLGSFASIIEEATRFIASDEGKSLAEANKRITNILKKSGFDVQVGVSPRALPNKPDSALFREDEETALFQALGKIGEASLRLKDEMKFAESLAALAPLNLPVKAFFDKVMVNAEDHALRDNRITLLLHARAYMNQVADLSLMAN